MVRRQQIDSLQTHAGIIILEQNIGQRLPHARIARILLQTFQRLHLTQRVKQITLRRIGNLTLDKGDEDQARACADRRYLRSERA